VPETPTWARFDEDEIDGEFGSANHFGSADHFGSANGFTDAASDRGWDASLSRVSSRTVSPILVTREPEPPPPGGPDGFEEYESWTLPQLRGRFRAMSLEQVQALLDWETGHLDRPPYVTMLSNRAASISGR
jgi:hypothetical protein